MANSLQNSLVFISIFHRYLEIQLSIVQKTIVSSEILEEQSMRSNKKSLNISFQLHIHP
jgi:hypothetical protein